MLTAPRRALACAFATFVLTSPTLAADAGEVNVYSYRQPYLIDPLFKVFTKDTGIKVNVIFAKEGLHERMEAEGRNSPADVLLSVDIGTLTQAVDRKLTQPVKSDLLEKSIPAAYRDSKGEWFALTRRGRVVFAAKDRVKQDSITYEELADPKWKGKVCIRSGQHVYNVALIASMLAHHDEAYVETWLRGVKANLAHKPSGNDRSQVKSIYAGECDISIGNTYYLAQMLQDDKEPEQKTYAEAVKVLLPNAEDRGTHVNVSGIVMAAHAPHRENALKLMEFLATDEAQRIYAEVNNEYPVAEGVPVSPVVQSFGQLKADPIALEEIASHRKRASELVDKVGFDDGPSS